MQQPVKAQPMPPPRPGFYTVGEVAALFRVDPKTITRWEAEGRFNLACPDGAEMSVIKTPGGHRRINKSLVDGIVSGAVRWPAGRGDE